MTTEEKIAKLEQELMELKTEFYKNNFNQQQVFVKDVLFKGQTTFSSTSTFTSLNPTTSFALSVTPTTTRPAISAPTGGATVDTESRNAINSIRSVLTAFGFTL